MIISKICRLQYKLDAEIYQNNKEVAVYAVDMQKILLVPRMPDVKENFFTSRLINFNETFANLKKEGEHISILWHEAIAGRSAPNVASAYFKVIQIGISENVKKFIFWGDNCCAQNKNWSIITFFVIIANKYGVEIKLKFLVTGHTFNAADGLHGRI